MFLDSHWSTLVQGGPPAPSSPPSLSLSPFVSVVVAFSRFIRPHHRAACESGCSGKTKIRHRVCCHSRVAGRRRQGCHQRHVVRLGSGCAGREGWTQIGDRRRWRPVFRDVQLAVDATLLSPLQCDGTARPFWPREWSSRGTHRVGWSSSQSTVGCVGWGGRRSVVRKDEHVRTTYAKANARSEPRAMSRRVEQPWPLSWGALLACVSARAFATSLLDLPSGWVDGAIPHALRH